MHPEAVVTHRTSRRLRIKIPSKKGNLEYFASLLQHLSHYPGIENLEANPTTGSILLITSLGVEILAEYARDKKLFDMKTDPLETPQTIFQAVTDAFSLCNAEARSFTGGMVDLPSLAFLIFAGMGIYQISRGNLAMPAWYTAFWYAQGILWQAMPKK